MKSVKIHSQGCSPNLIRLSPSPIQLLDNPSPYSITQQPPLPHSVTRQPLPLFHHSATPPFSYSTTPPLIPSLSNPPPHSVTRQPLPLFHHSATPPFSYSTTLPLIPSLSNPPSLFSRSTVPQHCSGTRLPPPPPPPPPLLLSPHSTVPWSVLSVQSAST